MAVGNSGLNLDKVETAGGPDRGSTRPLKELEPLTPGGDPNGPIKFHDIDELAVGDSDGDGR